MWGLWPGLTYPRVPGHEIAGIIDTAGEGVNDGSGVMNGSQANGLALDGMVDIAAAVIGVAGAILSPASARWFPGSATMGVMPNI